MRIIFFLRGIPASGKSYWAKNEMKKYPDRFKRVNKDLLREMLDGGDFSTFREKTILRLRDNIIESSLRNGFDVIVDDTNFSDKHWYRVCEIASYVGDVKVVEKFFPITLTNAIARNDARHNSVPQEIIQSMYDKHVKGKRIEQREEYFLPVVKPPIEKHKDLAIIVDIDGTIAYNDGHRNHYDPTKVIDDKPIDIIIDMVDIYDRKGYNILLVSGRDSSCREDTEMWLKMHKVRYVELYMRKDGDRRPDYIIKKEIYDEHIEPYFNVKFVLDDRDQIVKMWRGLGLKVLQCNFGDF